MSVQVLVTTMNQKDHSLLKRMNIQTDAIIGNQSERNEIECFDYKNRKIEWFSFAERGVGLNRNNTLMRASKDIVSFADDDMVFVDGYEKIIVKAFNELPNADILVFNIRGSSINNSKIHRIWFSDFMRYGAVRISARLSSLRLRGIFFNLCFGGGADYCHGEDSLFLADCLKKGLKIYAVPVEIAYQTNERESTWFKGYDDKYLSDTGMLFYAMTKRWWKLLCLQDVLRHRKIYNFPAFKALKVMLSSVKNNNPENKRPHKNHKKICR